MFSQNRILPVVMTTMLLLLLLVCAGNHVAASNSPSESHLSRYLLLLCPLGLGRMDQYEFSIPVVYMTFIFVGFVAVLGAGTVFFKDLLSPTAIISILGVAFGFTPVLNGLLSYVGYETSDENAHKFVGASVFFFVLSCLMVLYHVIRRWLAIRRERGREREAQAKRLRSAAVENLFSDAGKV